MGRWLPWAICGAALMGASLAVNGTFSGNATATACTLPMCDAANSSCTASSNMISLKVRVSYQSVNTTLCPVQGAAYCPIVDRFSALDLVPLSAEILACGPMKLEFFTAANYSADAVLDTVMFTQNDVELCTGKDDLNVSRKAFAEMLVLNVTLNKGFLNYNTNGSVPVLAGTGIQRTCDDSGLCIFDPTLPCIGGFNNTGRNGLCAECLTSAVLQQGVSVHPTVFVAFYGTDAASSELLSGGQNPINFQKYSLGGVYNILVTSTENYINKAVNFNWGSLLNTTLGALNLTLPDFQSIYNGVVDKLLGNDNGGTGAPPASPSPSPSPLPSPTSSPSPEAYASPSPSPSATNSTPTT